MTSELDKISSDDKIDIIMRKITIRPNLFIPFIKGTLNDGYTYRYTYNIDLFNSLLSLNCQFINICINELILEHLNHLFNDLFKTKKQLKQNPKKFIYIYNKIFEYYKFMNNLLVDKLEHYKILYIIQTFYEINNKEKMKFRCGLFNNYYLLLLETCKNTIEPTA